MIKKVYKVKGMHCSSCAMSVEWALEDVGAKGKCSFAKAEVEVEFDESKVDEKKIAAAVKAAGYEIGE